MPINTKNLLTDLKATNPEEVYQLFMAETDPIQKDFLKSIYDLLLQTRQAEFIARQDFVR